MSALTDQYLAKKQELEANPIAAYQSQYKSAIDNVLNDITNRKAFSYDFNADPLYQNYKDQYVKLGKEANMNAVANASALTGGYGNTYAVQAGAQANQQYLTELNSIIPQLYDKAMNRYEMEGSQLKDKYATLGDAEDRAYTQYRGTVDDYNTALNYYQNAYNTEKANDQWQAEYDAQMAQMAAAAAASQVSASSGSSGGSTKNTTDTKKNSSNAYASGNGNYTGNVIKGGTSKTANTISTVSSPASKINFTEQTALMKLLNKNK